ncbi:MULTISPECIES: type VII secretion target [Nocardia]|uniref:Type VII secretion target n=1 Tax=Nocardia aurea TaxID=2144174 RepID=A0ABV3FP13_9NOCA|nr:MULTISPECIES: type VII secretion target [Nocardia]
MAEFSADTDGLRLFATENAGIASELAGAASFDTVAQVSAMTPVFGLIGADYLLSFAAAQVLQARDINELSAKYQGLSSKAFSAALRFDGQDTEHAADLGAAAEQI